MKVGLYSNFLANPNARNLAANTAKADVMQALGVTHYASVKALNRNRQAVKDFYSMMTDHEIACGIASIRQADWDDGSAYAALDTLADLDGYAHDFYLAHEILEWAGRERRRRLVADCKQRFSTTLIRAYYGQFFTPLRRLGRDHRKGGKWEDYIVGGRGDPDILSFAVNLGGGSVSGATVSLQNRTSAAYRHQADYLTVVSPDSMKYCHFNVLDADPKNDVMTVLRTLKQEGADIVLVRVLNSAGRRVRAPISILKAIRDYG